MKSTASLHMPKKPFQIYLKMVWLDASHKIRVTPGDKYDQNKVIWGEFSAHKIFLINSSCVHSRQEAVKHSSVSQLKLHTYDNLLSFMCINYPKISRAFWLRLYEARLSLYGANIINLPKINDSINTSTGGLTRFKLISPLVHQDVISV